MNYPEYIQEYFRIRKTDAQGLNASFDAGDPAENAAITRAILDGETGPKRDIVLVNASAALVTAGRAAGFKEGVTIAAESIDSGAARRKAAELADFTQKI